jgi:hypothetical protein
MAGVIGQAIRPVFTFADEGLIQYEKIAAKKLADIIELLDLGEPANLQLDKRVYTPDSVARITYTVMEGILEPIILIDVSRQPSEKEEIEKEELEDPVEQETKYYYIPSFWVGITTRNHTRELFPGNINCGWEGYPPEGRLIGFEPAFDEGQAYGGQEYGYNHTVESIPGFHYAFSWTAANGEQPGAQIPRLIQIGTASDYTEGSEVQYQGWFGYQDWILSYGFAEYIIQSENGMVATENANCYISAPRDAYRPLFQANVDFSVFEDEELGPEFWHRSIIVGGATFGKVDINTGEVPDYACSRPCIFIGEDPSDAPPENRTTWTSKFDGSTRGGTVLPGEYEIMAMVQSYSCECFECEPVVRLILGGRSVEFEALSGDLVNYVPIMEIVDILPNICTHGTQARFYYRDLVLGGYRFCSEDDTETGGLRDDTPGWWGNSLYVDPMAATWRIGAPSHQDPFFNNVPCGPSPNDPPNSSACLGCTGDDSGCKGSAVCSEVPYCIKAGPGVAYDVRGLASFHLARVVEVDANSGRICRVQLVGNDGGQGGPCAETTFSYNYCWFGSGIDPSIPLGSDLSTYPDQGVIGGWVVGQLVVVIGYTNACTTLCDGSSDPPYGDFRWLVTAVRTPTDDFTNLFWSQFRCPNGIAFETYLNKLIATAGIQKDCGQLGGGQPVTLTFSDGCLKRVDEPQ